MARQMFFRGVGRYCQEENLLKKMGQFVDSLGEKAYVVSGEKAWGATGAIINEQLNNANKEIKHSYFRGFCCPENIDKHSKEATEWGADFIIGVGGGRCIDTAKGGK